jgi:hypothetical protein
MAAATVIPIWYDSKDCPTPKKFDEMDIIITNDLNQLVK